MAYDILVLSKEISPIGSYVVEFFNGDFVADLSELAKQVGQKKYRALVFDCTNHKGLDIRYCEQLASQDTLKDIPIVVITSGYTLQEKLKAYDIGCDDFIDSNTPGDEVCARITKSVFHQIATEQLSSRLAMATDAARTAMMDNSDLGANIQFLLQVHNCDNLDQLGQQFFSTIERYGLACSLQMRSEIGNKDMEANGMSKDLESQLLFQLKDKGRIVDFGRRTIVNYDRVSLLIKNMPVDDPEKYGAIKDNIFCLAQGINSRIISLEDKHKLLSEKDALRKLSSDVNHVISGLKNSYQDVMNKIVNEVEVASERIQDRLPHLALTEKDEEFIDQIVENLVLQTNGIFNDGLKVNDLFDKLESAVKLSLDSMSEPSEVKNNDSGDKGDNTVELF